MSGIRSLLKPALMGPILLVLTVALSSNLFPANIKLQLLAALVSTAIVVGIYVFVGNSGVVSFGQISFTAIGAFGAGITSMPSPQKATVFPELFPIIRENALGNVSTLVLATLLGAIFALVAGSALVRLSGLGAGIAMLSLLVITRNVLRNWDRVGPGAKAIPGIEQSTGLVQATASLILCIIVAYSYQISRWGRRLRASREDAPAAAAAGISQYQERLIAFVVSGALCGFAGGVYVHLLGSVTTEEVYIRLTFLTLAMLVIGGMGSLWGAVVGGLSVSIINSILFEAQNGIEVGPLTLTLPRGTSDMVLASLMALTLLWRPTGLTLSREFSLPRRK